MQGLQAEGGGKVMFTGCTDQRVQSSALGDIARVSPARNSYYEICLGLEEDWVICGFDELPYVLKASVNSIKYLIVFSGWGHLFFKAGREVWLDVLRKALAFLRVSFGVWLQHDYDNYFDLEAKFIACNYQQEANNLFLY